MVVSVEELVAEGRSALRRGDAATARQVFEQAAGESASGDVLEGLARASYLELDFPAAIAGWERANSAHRDVGDKSARYGSAARSGTCTGPSSATAR